jgi:hypothetical protein
MQKFRTFALLMVRSAPFMSNNFTVAYRLAGDSRLFNVILHYLWYCNPRSVSDQSPQPEAEDLGVGQTCKCDCKPQVWQPDKQDGVKTIICLTKNGKKCLNYCKQLKIIIHTPMLTLRWVSHRAAQ